MLSSIFKASLYSTGTNLVEDICQCLEVEYLMMSKAPNLLDLILEKTPFRYLILQPNQLQFTRKECEEQGTFFH